MATGVVLQLVRVLRVGTLKAPSSGTRAKGWSHLEAPGELGATAGDRERVGRPLTPHPCRGLTACPLPGSLTLPCSTHPFSPLPPQLQAHYSSVLPPAQPLSKIKVIFSGPRHLRSSRPSDLMTVHAKVRNSLRTKKVSLRIMPSITQGTGPPPAFAHAVPATWGALSVSLQGALPELLNLPSDTLFMGLFMKGPQLMQQVGRPVFLLHPLSS